MKKIKWSIYQDGKHVDSGVVTAESDKDVLNQIMLERDGKLAPDKSYSFTAGELLTSSYGDELQRSAHVAVKGMDEDSQMDGDYYFQPKQVDVVERIANGSRIPNPNAVTDDKTIQDCIGKYGGFSMGVSVGP